MRLIDLHCNWALQYAGETCHYDAAAYEDVRTRLDQLEGYLTGTGIAVLTCGRQSGDWARQPDAWKTLGEMIARYEAEFSGRLLIGPDDVARWHVEPPDGIAWGVLGIEGFDLLVRQPGDLDRLPGLYKRGVRVFQLVETEASALGGAAVPGDLRGLTELGRAFLDRLDGISREVGPSAPRLVVDLADLNSRTTDEVLAWFESDLSRLDRLLLVRSHGTIKTPRRTIVTGLEAKNLERFRVLGGVVGLSPGLPYFDSPEDFRDAVESIAAVPFRGNAGYMGIGIGTDFLNLKQSLPHLENVSRLTEWLVAEFAADIAARLISASILQLLLRAAGQLPTSTETTAAEMAEIAGRLPRSAGAEPTKPGTN
jgi:membrane dipeptidase